MTAMFAAHRRAAEFADLVDAMPSDQVDAEFAALVGVVGMLRTQAMPEPDPAFTATLRERLMFEADAVLVPQPTAPTPQRTRKRERRLVGVAAAAALVASTGGVAVAAQGALPGDALYPIKRGIENAQTQFNVSEAGKGNDLLGQASSRLDELSSLVKKPAGDAALTSTLQDFSSSAAKGSDLLFSAYQHDGDAADVTAVRDFTAAKMGVLTSLSSRSPESVAGQFAEAAALLADIDQQARVLCAGCDDSLALGVPDGLALPFSGDALTSLLTGSVLASPGPVGPDGLDPAATPTTSTTPGAGQTPDGSASGQPLIDLPKVDLGVLGNLLSPDEAGTPAPGGSGTPSRPLGGVTDGLGDLLTGLAPKPTDGSTQRGLVGDTLDGLGNGIKGLGGG